MQMGYSRHRCHIVGQWAFVVWDAFAADHTDLPPQSVGDHTRMNTGQTERRRLQKETWDIKTADTDSLTKNPQAVTWHDEVTSLKQNCSGIIYATVIKNDGWFIRLNSSRVRLRQTHTHRVLTGHIHIANFREAQMGLQHYSKVWAQ